jgi:ligand-binding sensor domain-containing protein/signal transduction histidine kinase
LAVRGFLDGTNRVGVCPRRAAGQGQTTPRNPLYLALASSKHGGVRRGGILTRRRDALPEDGRGRCSPRAASAGVASAPGRLRVVQAADLTVRLGVIGLVLGGLGAGFTPLAVAAAPAVRTSPAYHIAVWDTEDGLPEDTVTSMVQTRDGHLWFGTLNGLVRFDGLRFTVFDENNTPGLDSSQIVGLFEDRAGNLWVGTQTAGVVLLRDGQASGVGIGRGSSDKRWAAACQDFQGAVWLYLADGQLWRTNHGRFTPFVFGLGRPSRCRTLIAEEGGPVWMGSDDRLAAIGPVPLPGRSEPQVQEELPVQDLDLLVPSRRGGYWRLADGRVQHCRTNRLERDYGPYPWNRVPIAAACEDPQGNLVVGTVGAGVFWMNAQGRFQRVSTRDGLSLDIVLSVCADREGNLWVGTDGTGLNRVKRRAFDIYDTSRGLGVNVVESVSEDAAGALWIGSNGGGVSRWQGGTLRTYGPNDGLANSHVWSVLVDRDQRVWAGTWGGGLFVMEDGRFRVPAGSEIVPRAALALHQDRGGRLWVGTTGGLATWEGGEWRLYTVKDGLSADEVRALADDAQGNLWIGTVGGGLSCRRQGAFRTYHKADGLPSEDLSSLYVDRNDVLWVGTFGAGLVRLEQGRFTTYTTREGLAGNRIGAMIEDDQEQLWIGSNAGIMRLSQRELAEVAHRLRRSVNCRAYTKADGLPTRQCTIGSQPGAWRDHEGRLWFATVKGLVAALPADLRFNSQPPPVLIDSVLLDGERCGPTPAQFGGQSPLTVPAGKERVEIHFTSLNLSAPDRARFRYRLENYEKGWTDPSSLRLAMYSKLPPGSYRFHVSACNEDGLWNETGAVLALLVLPPFWRTWWFLSAFTLAGLGSIAGTVHYLSTQRLQRQLERLRHQEALQQDRSRIARDLHDQLGASLTQVALLGEMVESDKDQPDDVAAHARQIAQTARETTRVLDEIVWAINPANDTLESLVNYVCKYAQDYLAIAGLRYRLEVPASLPATVLPPEVRHNVFLAAKEAVTNVVRHAQATEARLRLTLTANRFTLELSDNGRGLAGVDAAALQARNGLRNMRKRLEDIGGQFAIAPGAEGGTVVSLSASY